jgi:hypothetical protein
MSEGRTINVALSTITVPAESIRERGFLQPIIVRQSDAWTDAAEERAAIAEHDGGAPRVWAEALARLDPANPPCDVPTNRWQRFIDDCGRFLDQG